VTDNHPSVIARNHLLDLATIWPELEAKVARGGGSAGEKVTGSKKEAPIPVDPHVIDTMAEIEAWVVFMVRQLMDEVTVEVAVPGPVRGTWAEPWRPNGITTASLLHQIADRVGHFTEHQDEMLAIAFQDDAKKHAKEALKVARPSGRRTIPLWVRCLEHDTDDQGDRIPCPGMYVTVLDPDSHGLNDMVCEVDRTHRMTPLEWQRSQRRGLVSIDPEIIDILVRDAAWVGGAG